MTEFPSLANIYNDYSSEDYAHFVINGDTVDRWEWYCGVYNDNPAWQASTAWLWNNGDTVNTAWRSAIGLSYSRLVYFVVDRDGNIRFGHSGSIAYDNSIVTDVIDELL